MKLPLVPSISVIKNAASPSIGKPVLRSKASQRTSAAKPALFETTVGLSPTRRTLIESPAEIDTKVARKLIGVLLPSSSMPALGKKAVCPTVSSLTPAPAPAGAVASTDIKNGSAARAPLIPDRKNATNKVMKSPLYRPLQHTLYLFIWPLINRKIDFTKKVGLKCRQPHIIETT